MTGRGSNKLSTRAATTHVAGQTPAAPVPFRDAHHPAPQAHRCFSEPASVVTVMSVRIMHTQKSQGVEGQKLLIFSFFVIRRKVRREGHSLDDQLATSVKHFSLIIVRSRLCLACSASPGDPTDSPSRVSVTRGSRPCAPSHDIGSDSTLATAPPQTYNRATKRA